MSALVSSVAAALVFGFRRAGCRLGAAFGGMRGSAAVDWCYFVGEGGGGIFTRVRLWELSRLFIRYYGGRRRGSFSRESLFAARLDLPVGKLKGWSSSNPTLQRFIAGRMCMVRSGVERRTRRKRRGDCRNVLQG